MMDILTFFSACNSVIINILAVCQTFETLIKV